MHLITAALLDRFPHGFTTRLGGSSSPPFDSLNLGGMVGDLAECVERNWRTLERETGLSFARVKQVHGAQVAELSEPCLPGKEADAVLSRTPGVAACVSVADCVPVLLADPISGAVAAAHAGWRGTLAKVVRASVQALAGREPLANARLKAVVGPSIGPCCYEVSQELAARFETAFGGVVRREKGAPHLDLWECNRRILLEAGLVEEGILVLSRCTSCEQALFFSHRRDRARTGRQVAFIAPQAPTATGTLP